MATRMRSTSTFRLLIVALAGCALGACSTDVGDQVCTEESIDRDRDDDCPYGPPGGPAVQVGDDFCSDEPVFYSAGAEPAECATEWTFPKVMEIFDREDVFTAGGGNCSNANCHGVASLDQIPINQPPMIAGNAAETHKSLTAWGMTDYGRPYIRAVDASASTPGKSEQAWILCNLTSLRGQIMPSPSGFQKEPGAESLKIIRGWVNCGMRETPGAGVGGAGLAA